MSIFREFVGAICCCLPFTTYELKEGKSQDLKKLSNWRAHPTLRVYNLEEHIADGGFSEVWRARHRTTSEEVCIKVVYLRKPGLRPEDAEVLRGEARYLRHLDHPNLLRCHDVFETKYHMVMILDYLSGGEMLEHLHRVEHYTEATAARLFAQIAGAVAYLHNLNIVHRDIKPENIMFARRVEECRAQDRPLRVKVIDLGMATVIMPPPLPEPAGVVGSRDPQQQQQQRSMRQEQQLLQKRLGKVLGKRGRSQRVGPAPCGCLGSPGFIAPEVVRGKPHTLAMDVYSLGVLLFIMLTGRKPWALREARSLKYAQRSISEAPGLKDSSYLSLSSSARELLLSMLADDPRNRLTALEVLRHPFIARFNAATAGSLLTPLRPLNDIIKRRMAQLASLRRFRGLAFAMMSDRGEGQRLGEFLEHVAERRKSVHKDLLSRAKQRRAVVVQRLQSDTQQDQSLGSSALPPEPREQAASAGKTFGAVTAFTGVAPESRTSMDSCSSQQALLPSRHRYVPSHLQPGMPEGQQLTSRPSLDSTTSSHQPLLPVAATAPTTDGSVGGGTTFLFSHHTSHQHNAHPPPQPWFGTSVPANRSNHTHPVSTAEVLGSGHAKGVGDGSRHISGNGGGSGGGWPLQKPHTVHPRHHLDTVVEPEEGDAAVSLAGSRTHGSASHPHNSNARKSLGGGRPSDNTALLSAALPDAVPAAASCLLSLNPAQAAKLQTINTCGGSNGIGRRRGWSISGSQQTHPDATTAAPAGASTSLSPSAGSFTPPIGPPPPAPCRNERARSSQRDVWRRRGRFATCAKGAEVELAALDPLGLVRELPGVVDGRLGRAHSAPESVSVFLGLGTWGDVDGKGVGSCMCGAHAEGRGRQARAVGEEAGAAGEDQAAWTDGCALGADMRAFSTNSWTLDLLANMDLLAALTGFNMANRNSSSELDLSVYNSTLYESGHYITAASSVLPQAPSYNWHGGAGYGAHPMTASPAAAAAAAVANFHQLQSELSRCQSPSLALDGTVHAGSHAAALLAAAVAVVGQSGGGTAATDGSTRGGTSAVVVRRNSREVWPAVAAAISAAVAATSSDRSGSNGGHRLMVSTQPHTTPTWLATDSGGGNPMGGGGTPPTKVSLGREVMNGAALSYPCSVSPFVAYACLPSSSWEVRMSGNGAAGAAAQQRPLLSTPVRTVRGSTALAAMQGGYRASGAGGGGGSEVVEIGSNAFFSARSGIPAGLALPEHSSPVLTSALAHVDCQDPEQPMLLLRATHRLGTGAVSASGLNGLPTAVSYGSPYTPRRLAMMTPQGGRVCVLRPAGHRGASSPAMTPHRSCLALKDLDEQIDAHRASLEESLYGGNNPPWACPSRSPAMSAREEAVSIRTSGTTSTRSSNATDGSGEPTIGAAVQGGPASSGACVGSTPSRLGAAGPGFNPNLTGSVRVIRTSSPLAQITESANAAWVTAAAAEAGAKERWRGAPAPAGPDEAMCGGTWHSGHAVAGTALLAPVRHTLPGAAAAAVEPTSAAGTAPAAIKTTKSVGQSVWAQVGNGVCGYEQCEVAVAAHAGRPDSTAAASALVGSRWRSPFEVMAAEASGEWGANAAACHDSSSGRAGAPFM